jgi:hypothetical protein
MRNSYKISVGKPEGREPLGKSECKWVGNIKMILQETGFRVWVGFIRLSVWTRGVPEDKSRSEFDWFREPSVWTDKQRYWQSVLVITKACMYGVSKQYVISARNVLNNTFPSLGNLPFSQRAITLRPLGRRIPLPCCCYVRGDLSSKSRYYPQVH